MNRTSISQFERMEMIYLCKGHKNRLKKYGNSLIDFQFIKQDMPLEARKILAVELSLSEIEESLREALWQNILYATAYEYLNIPISRQGFYNLRKQFLTSIFSRLN